jgi:hypothetical protein
MTNEHEGKNFFMEKSQEVRLSFEEGSEGIEYVTPLEKNLYRLDATPIFERTVNYT